MKTALIVSLSFNPGHLSHLLASYRQCEELGFKPIYCIAAGFVTSLPSGSRYIVYEKNECYQADLAVFVFPSQKNLMLIRSMKRMGAKIVYVFHEPLGPLRVYRNAGFSYPYLAKLWIINRINALTVKWSDAILLPSKKAVDYYESSSLYKNSNYHYLPLQYDDESIPDGAPLTRRYFSYIGTVAADHSFNEYLRFVEWAVGGNYLPEIQFLIATKSDFTVPESLMENDRVIIRKGRPLSNAEINECYSSSFLVWNAYARTTQSGVLAKSFMFGTPAIVLRKNLSEFAEDGEDVVAIDDNSSFEQIEGAIMRVLNGFEGFSKNARNRFLSTFYYRNYNDRFRKIIESI